MFTPKDYKKRIEALGYTISSFARHCDVDRKTIERHCSGRIDPIKRLFWMALDREDGKGWP